jgi:hypothetical protein
MEVKGMLKIIYFLILCSLANNANAAILNGGFETGDLTGWVIIGDVSIQTSSFGSGPTENSYQAVLTNDIIAYMDGYSSEFHVYPLSGNPGIGANDSFFGLPIGTLNSVTLPPHSGDYYEAFTTTGSGIKQSFYGKAGQIVSFDWNYLTNDGYNYDYSFVSLTSSDTLFIHKLAGNLTSELWPEEGPPLVPSNTLFRDETGFNQFSFILSETCFYTIGVGVVGVTDDIYDSGLIVDNFKITSLPEPATVLLVSIGLAGLVVLSGKEFRKR